MTEASSAGRGQSPTARPRCPRSSYHIKPLNDPWAGQMCLGGAHIHGELQTVAARAETALALSHPIFMSPSPHCLATRAQIFGGSGALA